MSIIFRAVLGLVALATMAFQSLAGQRDPLVPPGRDPGGPAVAIIGNGVDYTNSVITEILARDGEGQLIGWDFRENDDRPFDVAPVAKSQLVAFVNEMKRTKTALRLIPVRAAGLDANGLAPALAFASRTPARVALIPSWQSDKQLSDLLKSAQRNAPQLLIVLGTPATASAKDLSYSSIDSVVIAGPKWAHTLKSALGLLNAKSAMPANELKRLLSQAKQK